MGTPPSPACRRAACRAEAAARSARSLSALPIKIIDWVGEDAPLDDSIIRSTDTDDHVSRIYRRQSEREAVSLFIGSGVRIRDLMPHRPEVCYTGAGWTLEVGRHIELPLANGSVLPCGLQTFYRAGLRASRVAVLNYYIVDGEYCADVSLLRSRAWRVNTSVSCVAQVQMAAAIGPSGASGEDAVREFASRSAPAIRDLLKAAVERIEHGQTAEKP